MNNTPKKGKKFPGIDVSPWKVVTYAGKELSRLESFKDVNTKKVSKVTVRRWNGFRQANAVAHELGGVAIRA